MKTIRKVYNTLLLPLCFSILLGACASGSNVVDKEVTSEITGSSDFEGVTGMADPSQPGDATGMTSSSEPVDAIHMSATADDASAGPSTDMKEAFYYTPVTEEIFSRIQGVSYKEDCIVPARDLRYVHILHKDIDGNTHEGEIICHKEIAEDLTEIFYELYLASYPIERVRLVDEYDADDEMSMRDNNSSCFNYRPIASGASLSKHALGVAIDINPLYNPYVRTRNGETTVQPETAVPYTDRSASFDYKLEEGDLCYTLFIEYGFEWGGAWRSLKDYQHFELPDARVEEIRAAGGY